jgi:GDPmannose 4,6-dehydratase|tara:strand:- start:612 stop:1679 length:1068 start_codon:yes stop_codon:yes gene_type:complete
MSKKAFITGVNGQDGSYLAELLLEKGYEVHGMIRRSSSFNTKRIDHIIDVDPNFKFHYGDVTDPLVMSNLISKIQPDEIYSLAAQSHVKVSFELPYYTAQTDALGTLTILEAMKNHCPNAKFYQASTSELYGGMDYNMPKNGYTEESKFHPRSPYGVAKLYGFWIVRNYREAYGLYACNGILFNHESERRGETFVTRKITINLAEVACEKRKVLKIGNLDAKRDWGHARDYVDGMWRMLQRDEPEDFVLSTNKTHSVRDFIEEIVPFLGYDIVWKGKGVNEKGYDKVSGKLLVEVDEKYFRPSEVNVLLGDYSKAKEKLDWTPKIEFKELARLMIESDKSKLEKKGYQFYETTRK